MPEREQIAWRVADRAGVPVPETLCAIRSGEGAIAVQRSVPGSPLRRELSSDVVESLATVLARLHTAAIQEEDRAYLPDVSLSALLPRLAAWAEEAEDASLCRAVDALAEQFAEIEERPAAFVHGDCHAGNILADGQAITAVIDWEEAALGDPRIDVVRVINSLGNGPSEARERFLQCYQGLAGYSVGPKGIWGELSGLRARIVSAWVKHALAQGRPLPTANPQVWID